MYNAYCIHIIPQSKKTCILLFAYRRNQNYHDILKGMGALKHKNLSQFDLTNQFTHLFFLGDLNYRIDQLSATEIVEYAKKNDNLSIFSDDQLKREMEKKKVFVGFGESCVLFTTC